MYNIKIFYWETETLLCKGFTFMCRDKPTRNGGPRFFITTPPRPSELRFLFTTGLFVVGFFPRNRKHYIEGEKYTGTPKLEGQRRRLPPPPGPLHFLWFSLVNTISDWDAVTHEEHCDFERNGYKLIMIRQPPPPQAFRAGDSQRDDACFEFLSNCVWSPNLEMHFAFISLTMCFGKLGDVKYYEYYVSHRILRISPIIRQHPFKHSRSHQKTNIDYRWKCPFETNCPPPLPFNRSGVSGSIT